MSSETIRVGVIGLGMGMGHVEGYRNCPGVQLAALCDRDEAWLAERGESLGVQHLFTDYRKLLDLPDLDAVSVCLPTVLHAEVTLAALQRGKHVLCEKPMALNAGEAHAMADAAVAARRVLMVSQNRRFIPEAQYLHRAVSEGQLGTVYFVRTGWRRPMGMLPSPVTERGGGVINRNWFNQRDRGGGALRDLGSHMLDLSLWLLGFPQVADVVGASFSAFLPAWGAQFGETADAEDLASGMVRFTDGRALQLEASFGSHVEREVIFVELYGTAGGASWRDGLRILRGEPGAYSTDLKRITAAGGSTQAEFTSAIRECRQPLVTPDQSVAVIELLDRLYQGGITPYAPSPPPA